MPDYIYLLENRLTADQRHALLQLREAAREAEMILFLTGDAVRDLTSGHAVRDLEVAVHGDARKLKKTVEKLGAEVWGQSDLAQALYLCFPGTVRVDLVSTHRIDYTKLDKPVYHPASIQEDLRRRDFTINAMAISLNEGSFGLLMDPLNGVADMEARTLRLVSNYGFLEEPSSLIRATRYMARLEYTMDPKTQTRYDNAKGEDVIERLSAEARSRELEQIGHEEDGLKVLHALEAEGWLKILSPVWTVSKADEEKLKALRELAVQLQVQGVYPDMSAPQMQLLTAKLNSKDLAALKQQMLRPGFVAEWNSLDSIASKFAKVLLSKDYVAASAAYKLFTTYDPEAVLWLAFTSKDKAVQERFNLFLKVWPEARQRIPHALLQEMRITPELATYKEIVHAIFLELIDDKLSTPEEARAFLEPHSPPAPPPQVTIKRPRAKRGEAKVKERSYDDDEDSDEDSDDDEEIDDLGSDDDEVDPSMNLPKGDLDTDLGDDVEPDPADAEADEEEGDGDGDEPEPTPTKRGGKASKEPAPPATKGTAKKGAAKAPAKSAKQSDAGPTIKAAASEPLKPERSLSSVPAKPAPKVEPAAKHVVAQAKTPVAAAKQIHVAPKSKAAPVKAAPVKAAPAVAAPAKPASKPAAPPGKKAAPPPKPIAKAAKPATQTVTKVAPKSATKTASKAGAKPAIAAKSTKALLSAAAKKQAPKLVKPLAKAKKPPVKAAPVKARLVAKPVARPAVKTGNPKPPAKATKPATKAAKKR